MRILCLETRPTIAVTVLTSVRVRRVRTTKFVHRPTIPKFTVLSNIVLYFQVGSRQLR
jgi:hypothetical protein